MIHSLLIASLAAGVHADPPAANSLPQVVKAEPDEKLNAKFRQTDGWVGADGAFSVPISDTRTLWLFSDTWVGTVRDGKRKDVKLVNNSIGVQDGKGADMKLTFAIQKDANGKHKAIFIPPDGKGWFWLFGGYHENKKLHIFLPRLEKTDAGGAFGFKAIDMWLGTVSNPDHEPTKWKIDYAKVPHANFTDKRKFSFGTAVLRVGDHAYIYGHQETPRRFFPARKLIVARVGADKLTDFDDWRFYSQGESKTDGEWKADAKDATGLADDLGAEFSVSYLPGLKKYALVYTENGLSDRIVGRFASSPEGPWSDPVLLYTCPEMK
ncbi:MAG: DUF4185 domain-containing protein, partial [Planctomycetia bacterium]|nr:DUF4185 domain-containing protein [Planctomycetia bacterium]